MKMIDHDPKEYRFTKADQAFITIATAVVLVLAGLGIKFVFNNFGYIAGYAVCSVSLIAMFALAFWLERRR